MVFSIHLNIVSGGRAGSEGFSHQPCAPNSCFRRFEIFAPLSCVLKQHIAGNVKPRCAQLTVSGCTYRVTPSIVPPVKLLLFRLTHVRKEKQQLFGRLANISEEQAHFLGIAVEGDVVQFIWNT